MQEDIDFFTQAVGLRKVKQTVLFDGTAPTYHLYYANANAEIGSVMTTFPFRQAGLTGRRGSGQVQNTAFSVPAGAATFWAECFKRMGCSDGMASERFGQKALAFKPPAGLGFEVIEDAGDTREPWTTNDITADVAARGFHSISMAVREAHEQEQFLIDGLGFVKVGSDGAYSRYAIAGGGAARTIELVEHPDMP